MQCSFEAANLRFPVLVTTPIDPPSKCVHMNIGTNVKEALPSSFPSENFTRIDVLIF